MKNPKIADLQKTNPSYFLVQNQGFEKLTKGTALGGLSPQNDIPMSPLLKNHTAKMSMFLQKVLLFVLIVLVGLSEPDFG